MARKHIPHSSTVTTAVIIAIATWFAVEACKTVMQQTQPKTAGEIG